MYFHSICIRRVFFCIKLTIFKVLHSKENSLGRLNMEIVKCKEIKKIWGYKESAD